MHSVNYRRLFSENADYNERGYLQCNSMALQLNQPPIGYQCQGQSNRTCTTV